MIRSFRTRLFWVLLVTFALCVLTAAQGRTKRLILADGSFQAVKSWTVKGDRVRYYSTDRSTWEELPTALVDWPATEKYNRDLVEGTVSDARDERQILEREEEEAAPRVAQGLRLPETGGVFLFDTFQSRPQLVELVQNGSDINKETGKNILRSIINPLPNVKQSLELKGKRARVQSHVTQPAIYIDISYADDEGTEPSTMEKLERFKLVRVNPRIKANKRVVGNLKLSVMSGMKMKEQRELVPTKAEPLGPNWVKVQPEMPLEPGEYALIEMITPEQMNLYVWDFGVDPAAPANPTAWQPAAAKPLPTGTEESPILTDRPKDNR